PVDGDDSVLREALLILAIVLAGCISQPEDVRLRFTASGGFMPPEAALQELTIEGGRATYTLKSREGKVTYSKTADIPEEELRGFAQLLEEAGFFSLEDRYTAPEGVQVMDAGRAEVTAALGGREKTVVIEPYITDYMPPALVKVDDRIQSWIQSLRPAPVAVPRPVRAAQEDLASKLGLEAGKIAVVRAEPWEWPDTSLGCPREGMFYAQVITPGYRVVLEAGGRLYEYHTDQERAVYCE
ncbi:MAG TPA: hypothetical protein VI877_04555, partial [Dehalococcoidia bacterium]|nr:hypothetical protein [Dehalococcoidia bacterium]